jgi:type IV pilus assembly protein PilO
MADIRDTRRKMMTALIVLVVLDVAALGVLLSPIGTQSGNRQMQVGQMQRELQARTAEVAPLQGIDKKVEEAKKQVNDFFATRLPSRYSQIADELGKIAQENHVQFATVHYTTEDTDIKDTSRVLVDASLAGDYAQVVKFINALERSKTLFLVDGVSLGQESTGGGAVRLSIKLETYMNSGAPATTATPESKGAAGL